jgi:hypothetical protein
MVMSDCAGYLTTKRRVDDSSTDLDRCTVRQTASRIVHAVSIKGVLDPTAFI